MSPRALSALLLVLASPALASPGEPRSSVEVETIAGQNTSMGDGSLASTLVRAHLRLVDQLRVGATFPFVVGSYPCGWFCQGTDVQAFIGNLALDATWGARLASTRVQVGPQVRWCSVAQSRRRFGFFAGAGAGVGGDAVGWVMTGRSAVSACTSGAGTHAGP